MKIHLACPWIITINRKSGTITLESNEQCLRILLGSLTAYHLIKNCRLVVAIKNENSFKLSGTVFSPGNPPNQASFRRGIAYPS